MQRLRFSCGDVPPGGRLRAWDAMLSAFCIRSFAPADGAFRGEIESCTAPSGMSFSLVASGPQEIAALPDQSGDTYWLALGLKGEGRFGAPSGGETFRAGDMLYGHRGVPAALRIEDDFEMLLVNIPGPIIARRLIAPPPELALHLPGTAAANRILASLLEGIARSIEDLDDAHADSLELAAVELLQCSLVSARSSAPASARAPSGTLKRICAAVDSELGDPDLSIRQVARRHGLSVRYVQKLFEKSGRSFRDHVRGRRLERCRAELANPELAHLSISAICFRWGFNDSATFSRAFRQAFGVTPREYRRQARH